MPLKDVVKVSRKTFFNPRGWLGYDMLKTQFKTSWEVIKNLYSPPQAGTPETFENASSRFKLTDTQLAAISKNFRMYTIIFVSCAVLTFLFSFYLLFTHGTFAGFVIGISTTAVFLAYAFRYSFWRFEITHRKLGCTFKEWWSGKPLSKEDTRHD
ncbi:MAG TPA: type IVB secretion system protein IcmV [Gammaproteobacteria bacterium]|nr:type IVB secretion system protein IcmV [Gammaproteobacteria bacterium]